MWGLVDLWVSQAVFEILLHVQRRTLHLICETRTEAAGSNPSWPISIEMETILLQGERPGMP